MRQEHTYLLKEKNTPYKYLKAIILILKEVYEVRFLGLSIVPCGLVYSTKHKLSDEEREAFGLEPWA